jgi:hypothetical protein
MMFLKKQVLLLTKESGVMKTEGPQKIWDELLLECWVHDCTVLNLIIRFSDAIGEPALRADEFEAIAEVFKLERCVRLSGKGSTWLKAPVRSFVYENNTALSDLLWGGGSTVAEILDVISAFKFKKRVDTKRNNEKRTEQIRKRSVRHFSSREVKSKHSWGVVK